MCVKDINTEILNIIQGKDLQMYLPVSQFFSLNQNVENLSQFAIFSPFSPLGQLFIFIFFKGIEIQICRTVVNYIWKGIIVEHEAI